MALASHTKAQIGLCFLALLASSLGQYVFINEFHYDNTGLLILDAGQEGVEVAGPSGTDLTPYKLEFYSGSASYGTVLLTGTLPGSTVGFKFFPYTLVDTIGGIALCEGGSALQFVSYEGVVTAANGCAAGNTSTDVGVVETGTRTDSLQLQGTGKQYFEFSWAGPIQDTHNAMNNGQTLNPPDDCMPPGAIANSDGSHTGCPVTSHGGTCAVTCDAGYTKSGDLSCTDGSWSNATCDPLPCSSSPPSVANSDDTHTSCTATHGNTCTLTCDSGYSKTGDFTCTASSWDSQSCTPLPCSSSLPSVANSDDTHTSCTATHGNTCALTCDSGYSKTGDFTCTASSWDSQSCTGNPCATAPTASIANSDGSHTGCPVTSHGGTCAVTCDAGYTKSGDFTCTAGVWSAPPTCNGDSCPSSPTADVAHSDGSHAACGATPHGGTCAVVCDAHFGKTGDFECTAGQWGPAPKCIDTRVPEMVGTPTVAVLSATSLRVVWPAAARAERYAVSHASDANFTAAQTNVTVALFKDITGLTPGNRTYIRIVPINYNGDGPVTTASGVPVAPPTPPRSLVVDSHNSTAVMASWNVPKSDGGSPVSTYDFEVSRGTTVVRVGSVDGLKVMLGSLATAEWHDVRVRAVNSVGSSPWATGGNAPVGPPSAPRNPVAAVASERAVSLKWTRPLSDGGLPISTYTVSKGRSMSGPFSVVYRSSSTSATISGLEKDVQVIFQITAANAKGVSPAAVVSATPVSLCGNGERDAGEQCDDANYASGDGCSEKCLVEDGFVCPVDGGACSRSAACAGDAARDCAGVCGGSAAFDTCGDCSGGTTGRVVDGSKDFCGVCFGGNGTLDVCGICDGLGKDQDACGVCFGDNSTCLGCDGVPNSGKVNDACGVCGGDSTSCLGCDGVPIPQGGKHYDVCGVCGGTNVECRMGCDGVYMSGLVFDCNGVCNGTAAEDDCGICAGGDTGFVPNANQGSCGICFTAESDDSIRLMCGDCFDGSILDACGVCGGNNESCFGCDGLEWSGASFDSCGICGGNDTTCVTGCDGVPGSAKKVDCAGVCGGEAFLDSCGMCSGGSTGVPPNTFTDVCGDCFGGNAARDACGQCYGNNTAKDECGVCFGDDAAKDVCGECFGRGRLQDACGECRGGLKAVPRGGCTRGCDGVRGSGMVEDACGVCGGDGTCASLQSSQEAQSVGQGDVAKMAAGIGAMGTVMFLCSAVAILCFVRRRRSSAVTEYHNRLLTAAPSGTIAIVFLQVDGCELLNEACPDAMEDSMRMYEDLVRDLLRSHYGYEVKCEADKFLATFSSVWNAVQFCVRLQDELLILDWPANLLRHPKAQKDFTFDGQLVFRGLRVSVGLHVGDPVVTLDERTERVDYYGVDMNRAARIMGVAAPGQMLLSVAVLDALNGLAQDDVSVCFLGVVHLKGIADAVKLYQFSSVALEDRDFPPLADNERIAFQHSTGTLDISLRLDRSQEYLLKEDGMPIKTAQNARKSAIDHALSRLPPLPLEGASPIGGGMHSSVPGTVASPCVSPRSAPGSRTTALLEASGVVFGMVDPRDASIDDDSTQSSSHREDTEETDVPRRRSTTSTLVSIPVLTPRSSSPASHHRHPSDSSASAAPAAHYRHHRRNTSASDTDSSAQRGGGAVSKGAKDVWSPVRHVRKGLRPAQSFRTHLESDEGSTATESFVVFNPLYESSPQFDDEVDTDSLLSSIEL